MGSAGPELALQESDHRECPHALLRPWPVPPQCPAHLGILRAACSLPSPLRPVVSARLISAGGGPAPVAFLRRSAKPLRPRLTSTTGRPRYLLLLSGPAQLEPGGHERRLCSCGVAAAQGPLQNDGRFVADLGQEPRSLRPAGCACPDQRAALPGNDGQTASLSVPGGPAAWADRSSLSGGPHLVTTTTGPRLLDNSDRDGSRLCQQSQAECSRASGPVEARPTSSWS